MQDGPSLARPQTPEVLLNRGCCTRDSREVKNDLMRWFTSMLLCKLWYQKERSILSSSHFTSSICNHLQQALQIKFRGESNSNTVELCQLFCLLLQIRNELCATLIYCLSHRADTPSSTITVAGMRLVYHKNSFFFFLYLSSATFRHIDVLPSSSFLLSILCSV